ncbi:hypothetical protein VTN00DRAFT_2345 [Thermoascus crustaceus]|uniref:uncharacterized protein n=1 Tax=Thermoascus crustaceus TaxID=5088 RepID=UPI00374390D3
MEAPELHGGGAAHASTPAIGYVASQPTEIQELPDTPTPSRWTQQGPSRPSTNENYLNLAQASQKNSLGGAGAYRDGIASSLTVTAWRTSRRYGRRWDTAGTTRLYQPPHDAMISLFFFMLLILYDKLP